MSWNTAPQVEYAGNISVREAWDRLQGDPTTDTVLMFMCQSGGRSKIAAGQCAALGYSRCFNVAEGFDGDLDEYKHRCSINGWRAAGLPWAQS